MAAAKPILGWNHDRLKIFAGNANPVSDEICLTWNCPQPAAFAFSDGEISLS